MWSAGELGVSRASTSTGRWTTRDPRHFEQPRSFRHGPLLQQSQWSSQRALDDVQVYDQALPTSKWFVDANPGVALGDIPSGRLPQRCLGRTFTDDGATVESTLLERMRPTDRRGLRGPGRNHDRRVDLRLVRIAFLELPMRTTLSATPSPV